MVVPGEGDDHMAVFLKYIGALRFGGFQGRDPHPPDGCDEGSLCVADNLPDEGSSQ